MTAFYLTAASPDLLAAMLVGDQGGAAVLLYRNVLMPQPARAAVPAGTDTQGNPVAAVPAAGVAGMFYMSVNLPGVDVFPAAYPSGVTEDDANGQAVLGVWA